ncbi:MAG: hypothetical protein K5876_06460 [Ruminiclostridium sp.]|nr:hypothetical protein [Ruminiclostridium sp.]
MNKSVYSLVLSDDVVAAVDMEAHRAGMSRSAFINKVLAEAVSYVTPEKRMNNIFAEIEQLINSDIFRIMPRPSETALAMRSALHYKYNPVIRYSIEFSKNDTRLSAKVSAYLRTQSDALISCWSAFLALWLSLERASLGNKYVYTAEGGKFTRAWDITVSGNVSDNLIAESLSQYVTLFDSMIKLYFSNAGDPDAAEALVRERYKEFLSSGSGIL